MSEGRLLARLEPVVATLAAASASKSRHGQAADAALVELAAQMVDREVARSWDEWLAEPRALVRDSIDSALIQLAREQCQRDVRMLGPLYEALCDRTVRHPRGQYFTPPDIARAMAELIDCYQPESVLDPAAGAGVLLGSCASVGTRMGLDNSPVCVALATAGLVTRGGHDTHIQLGDFLSAPCPTLPGAVDAVIANPPYQRHHLIEKTHKRALADRYTSRFGPRISALSSSYVYFLLEAIERVRDGGVIVFITPADYLDARFGESIKHILRDQVTLDEVLLFDRSELAFDDVLTTSAITVLRKVPPARHHLVRFREAGETNERRADELDAAQGWSLQFGSRRSEFESLSRNRPGSLSDHLRIRRGIATGANSFFLVDRATRDRWDLPDEFLSPVIASARDLPDHVLRTADWQQLRDGGRPCWLLDCDVPMDDLRHAGLRAYLCEGERLGVHRRFNCRSKTPWYRVEPVPPPDIIVTYMQRGPTRFVRNDARCRVMSVFLNGFLLDGDVDDLLEVLGSDETTQLLRALSRTYGGGLDKIEPRALAGLPMPDLQGY